MIGYLRGVLLEVENSYITLDVNGVGYELELPSTTIFKLPALNETLSVYTHFVVREDAQLLYGFFSRRERDLFRELIKLNGVGPKLALALMSGLNVNELIHCVHANDASVLLKVPGVGKKTAERLLIELKDRLKQWTVETVDINHDSDDCFVQASGVHAESDAINALVSLGYKPQEATKAVTLIKEKGLAREELVRRALQSMH